MKMNRMVARIVSGLLVGLPIVPVRGAVKPHALFSDNVVLQRERRVAVWGTADAGEKVTVQFNGQRVSTTARHGEWIVRLESMSAGGPYDMTLAGTNTVTLKNVLVGDVWICSGQSNMAWPVNRSAYAEENIAYSKNPMIRLFTVPRKTTDEPQRSVDGQWAECGPETVGAFSAVGYYFGRDLQAHLGIPIGLINTSYGGTPAEAWTSREKVDETPSLHVIFENHQKAIESYPERAARHKAAMKKHQQAVKKAKANGQKPPPKPRAPVDPTQSPHRPAGLYNAMIHPLIPFGIRGAIWYQGESNAGRAHQYRTLFPAMIKSWREAWAQGPFPFLFVQLAPFRKIQPAPGDSTWAELREAQLLTTRKLPLTAMAVITDAGDEVDIHPKWKEPVGARLALAARALAYGERIVYSGPVCARQSIESNRVVLHFDHVGAGLVAHGGPLRGFAIAGKDRTFVNATAKIQGNTVVVSSPEVPDPVAVRYGWADFPIGNLWNADGLPATPFRTDDFPMVTGPKK